MKILKGSKQSLINSLLYILIVVGALSVLQDLYIILGNIVEITQTLFTP